MTTILTDHADTYRDENTALFRRRTEVRDALRLLTANEADVTTNRRVRHLRRQLDDVNAQIVQHNMGLVRSYTRRFNGTVSSDGRAEFESAGLLGLMSAVDSYDPTSGTFGQWAFRPIQREVLRAVRDVDHPNLTMNDFEKRPAILKAYRQLSGIDASYNPSDAEIAAAAGVTVGQVRRVLSPPQLESMNRHMSEHSDVEFGDSIPSDEVGTEALTISKLALAALRTFGLKALDARELYVIVRRFGIDGEPVERLSDIGTALNLSREAVRQIETKALAKLQHPLVLRKLNCAALAQT